MKNIFFHIYIFLKKDLFVNKCKKKTCYKENKSLFFDIMKNDQISLQKFVIFNMIADSHIKRYISDYFL